MSTRSAIASVLASAGVLALGWQAAGGLAALSPSGVQTSSVTSDGVTPQQQSPTAATSTETQLPTPAASAQPEQGTTGGYLDGSYTGQSVANRFGTWTLTATISGGQLTDVQATSTPLDPKSEQISSRAISQLTSAVIAAQSAEVSTISGATLTSQSYLTSLQSALDQAGS